MKKRGIFLLSLLLAAILCLQTAPAVMAADSEAGGVFFDFSEDTPAGATVHNATIADGMLSVQGTADSYLDVEITDALRQADSISIEMSVRLKEKRNNCTILSIGKGEDNYALLLDHYWWGGMKFCSKLNTPERPSGEYTIESGSADRALPVGEFAHVVATYEKVEENSYTMSLYLNGTLLGTAGPISFGLSDFLKEDGAFIRLGVASIFPDSHCLADFDYFNIYTRALSEAEIQNHAYLVQNPGALLFDFASEHLENAQLVGSATIHDGVLSTPGLPDSYLDVQPTDALKESSSHTIEMVVKLAEKKFLNTLLSMGVNDENFALLIDNTHTGAIKFTVKDPNAPWQTIVETPNGDNALTAGEYAYVAAAIHPNDGGGYVMSLYVNGTLVAETQDGNGSLGNVLSTPGAFIHLGASSIFEADGSPAADFACFNLFPEAFTAEEIADRYTLFQDQYNLGAASSVDWAEENLTLPVDDAQAVTRDILLPDAIGSGVSIT